MTTDSELLRQYAHDGDEEAFAEIVRRQADLVYSAAMRITGDGALAQDVTQAVFTKLAQQAARLSGYDTPVGWLHTTTRHTAINAIRGEARRRAREQEAFIMHHDSSEPEADWAHVRPVLDEAVDGLPEPDRKAVLLRFFKDLSHQEVGAILGVSEDGARKRVERALEKLREHFAHRGVKVSSALLASAIGAHSVQAAPAGLSAKIAQTSLASTAAAGGAGNTLLATLFMSTKLKIILAAAALLAVGGTLALTLQNRSVTPSDLPAKTFPTPPAQIAALSKALPPPAQVALPVAAPSMERGAAPVAESAPPAVPGQGTLSFRAAAPSTSSTLDAPVHTPLAGPKTDLNETILTGVQCLENHDVRGLLETLMPPDVLVKEGKGTLDEFVQHIESEPQTAEKLNNVLQVLKFVQEQKLTPTLNAEGTRAVFNFDLPTVGRGNIIFTKVDGFWYLSDL